MSELFFFDQNLTITMDKRKIVIQGVEGCFHHVAANAYYGEDVEIIPAGNFATLIELIQDETVCDGGIMAIENSISFEDIIFSFLYYLSLRIFLLQEALSR